MNECTHKWKPIWVCRKCGQQETEEPEDYEDPDELNADAERDRRIDDKLTGWTT